MGRLVVLWVIMGMVITSLFLCLGEESLIPEDPAERLGPGMGLYSRMIEIIRA